jgi:homoserine kinase type II
MPDPPTPPAQPGNPPAAGQVDPRSAGGAGAGGASGLSSVSLSAMPRMGGDGRQTFAADELAIVLSHFDLGVIEKIREFPRGSRRAPKLLIKAERGAFLLKRRARGKDDPYKVAFCHGIQLHLSAKQFPLPHLMGTRTDNNSMLRLGGYVYELFEYIKGTPYDQSPEATHDAGKALGLLHKLLRDYEVKYDPPTGSYHNAVSVYNAFKQIPATLAKRYPNQSAGEAQERAGLVNTLQAYYEDAVQRVESAGMSQWPGQIVHSDWHPGNMLFRGPLVVAVIDYDAARINQRVLDIANGALQFSIQGGGDDPLTWPESVDMTRFKRFLLGYDSVPDNVLTRAELRVIPWLMTQALIAESVIPIATTGMFARMDGGVFLEMVRRKCVWLQKHAEQLVGVIDG